MALSGSMIGLPFTAEGFAFFLEAVFLGLYLYGWDRLSPVAHWLCAIPIAISGAASSLSVVMVNAWMNHPAGFHVQGGEITQVDPGCRSLQPGSAFRRHPYAGRCVCRQRIPGCRCLGSSPSSAVNLGLPVDCCAPVRPPPRPPRLGATFGVFMAIYVSLALTTARLLLLLAERKRRSAVDSADPSSNLSQTPVTDRAVAHSDRFPDHLRAGDADIGSVAVPAVSGLQV